MCVCRDGGQDSGNLLWHLAGWLSAGRWRLKVFQQRKNRKPRLRSSHLWMCICVCMCVCNLTLHLSLCFLMAGLGSFLLSFLLSVYSISMCLEASDWFMVAASLRKLMWLSPLAVYPTLKELNNSSGSAAGLWPAQISAQGEWGGHLGTVTSPAVWGWAISSCSCEPLCPHMAQSRYKAVLWPGALLNTA